MLKILIPYDPIIPLLAIYLPNRIACKCAQGYKYIHIQRNSVEAKMGTSHMAINSRMDRQIAIQCYREYVTAMKMNKLKL